MARYVASHSEQARRAWLTRAVLLLLFCAVVSGFGWNYAREARWFTRALAERAGIMLDVQEAGVAAHLRNGKYNPEQLEPILARLAKAPLVARIELAFQDELLAWAPGDAPMTQSTPYRREVVIDPGITMGFGGRMPRGPSAAAGWLAFPQEAVTLTVWLDTSRQEDLVRGARLQFGLSVLGAVVAFALALLATESRRRQRDLELELLLARERVSHHQQLAQLGAGLAHETKNPLGLVRGMAQAITEADAPTDVREQAVLIIDEVDRTVRHVNAFLELAREMAPELDDVALDALFDGLAALVTQEARHQQVNLHWAPDHRVVRADSALLRRALLNLILNALKACREGGQVSIVAEATNGRIAITVADDGTGIAPEDLPKVCSPYFTRFEGGTGLGLSIVDQIARAHGWRLRIESHPGQGARVSLDGMEAVE